MPHRGEPPQQGHADQPYGQAHHPATTGLVLEVAPARRPDHRRSSSNNSIMLQSKVGMPVL